MSFYLVIGIIFTGILHAFVKKETVLKHVGNDDTKSVIKASVVGVPLPLCSCGVVPTALYLGENGASKGAVVSFLTSTPQTGVDSIIATYGMMGPVFAIFRAVAAFISGIFSGIVTNKFCKKESVQYKVKTNCSCSHDAAPAKTAHSCCSHDAAPAKTAHSCCSHDAAPAKTAHSCCSHDAAPAKTAHSCCSHDAAPAKTAHSCCSHDAAPAKTAHSCCSHDAAPAKTAHSCCSHDATPAEPSFKAKVVSIFTYGFGDFLDEIAVNLVIGLIIAALISTSLPETWIASIQSPILVMLIMLVIGIPMYVCSTASIPIAVSLMMKGISPGAAFVFLFAGPVTNIASLSILFKSLGKKTMAVYLTCIAISSVVCGLFLDAMISLFNSNVIIESVHAHLHGHDLYRTVIAIVFGLLIIRSLVKQFNTKRANKIAA